MALVCVAYANLIRWICTSFGCLFKLIPRNMEVPILSIMSVKRVSYQIVFANALVRYIGVWTVASHSDSI